MSCVSACRYTMRSCIPPSKSIAAQMSSRGQASRWPGLVKKYHVVSLDLIWHLPSFCNCQIWRETTRDIALLQAKGLSVLRQELRQKFDQFRRMDRPTEQTRQSHEKTKDGRHHRDGVQPGLASKRGHRKQRNGNCEQGVGEIELIVAEVCRIVVLLV